MKERNQKKISCILLCVVMLLQAVWVFPQAGEIKESELYARSAVLMDAESGRVLFEQNGCSQMPMASTTKIMTCILALENGNPEDTVTASSYAASQPKVHLGMVNGRKYKLKDLLYSLMLESHNDSAVAIAEHIGGSVAGFQALMNQKARDLGCMDTYFITPNGLDAQEVLETGEVRVHSTTARDLARIMMYCIRESPQKEAFLEITRTVSHSFADLEGKSSYSCNNHNAFLNMMEGALSGKTGFTANAGYCYVGALTKDGKTYVVALLACGWPNNKTYKWSDTRKLMNYGLDNFDYQDIWQDIELGSLAVENGIPDGNKLHGEAKVALKIEGEDTGQLTILLGKEENVTIKEDIAESLKAPVKENTQVGTITYELNGQTIRTYPVVTGGSVEKISYPWYFHWVLEEFLL